MSAVGWSATMAEAVTAIVIYVRVYSKKKKRIREESS